MKATPRIRKKRITAAELLRQIRALVLEEPRRLNMKTWIAAYEGRVRRNDFNYPLTDTSRLPACGTVGCIAGWGLTLLRRPNERLLAVKAQRVMSTVLGEQQMARWGGVPAIFSPYHDNVANTTPGTVAHARAVAKRIGNYLREHPELETRVIDVATRKVVQ